MGQGATNIHYMIQWNMQLGTSSCYITICKTKKYELVEDDIIRFLRLYAMIPQWPNDIYLKEGFRLGLKTKVKMAMISMPQGLYQRWQN
jgi:hypothetical protein